MALAVVLSQAFRGATTRPTIAEASLRAELANEPGLLWGVANDLRLLRTPLAWRVWASLAVSVSVPFLARAVGLSSAAVTDITLRVATLVCFGQLLDGRVMMVHRPLKQRCALPRMSGSGCGPKHSTAGQTGGRLITGGCPRYLSDHPFGGLLGSPKAGSVAGGALAWTCGRTSTRAAAGATRTRGAGM